MLANFLEAAGRGYWEASEQDMELLRQQYAEAEDAIELGVQ
jgi:magnesium chelatase subunit H